MTRRFPTFDEFINGDKQLKQSDDSNENAKVIIHSHNPQKVEMMSINDDEAKKYEFYELKKELLGLPTDILIGYRK